MAVVRIRVHGKEYQVACDDGQEEQLQFLASEVDERMKTLLHGMKSHPGEVMSLLLTALMMADEAYENRREIDYLNTEVNRLATTPEVKQEGSDRMTEIENTMIATLEDIAARIERIADRIELR